MVGVWTKNKLAANYKWAETDDGLTRAKIGLNLMVLVLHAAHLIGLLFSPTTWKRRGIKNIHTSSSRH
ncbi:LOW QUALITY PROTEIN: uncharacterized protein LOC110226086 [Arabidopsis lyrata subsp. lyrata]|uniref:LOW QUALITY PROTEIN: uncharacterized protein LOC110226086 n=1 Tax=Arabidopsis lyrata subsp. lyrata TaxID=81972 RepID=UPI000A29B870|nr:LOW QUALITY PROTEIN: uncharacterized protein LOC110226086 [Arabidopsis lyrata subsp. lyrata]|eukprot:XP_020872325.1 LOW QUALITY PROTEIN: uncharacterized protein LOC110226086 [Arabidopsis lyrata subsp. lyrata]